MRRRSRIAIVVLGLTLISGWGAAHTAETEAAWTTASKSATVFKAEVPPPIIDTCVATSAILGLAPKVTITWHYLAGGGNPPLTVAFFTGAGGLGGTITGPVGSGNYSTTGPTAGQYTTVFQGSLLGATLGNTTAIYLEARHGAPGWVSMRTSSSAVSSFAALGTNGRCDVTAPPV